MRILYTKYNETRNPLYQTRTCICREEETAFILKSAVRTESEAHVQSFPEKYQKIEKLYPAVTVLPCEMTEFGVRYPFIHGHDLNERLEACRGNLSAMLETLQGMLEKFLKPDPSFYTDFRMTEGFRDLFGDIDCSGDRCLCPANLDMILDNLMETGDGKIVLYDYEWVYDFPVPEEYIVYRILSRVYDKYFARLSRQIDFEKFVAEFGITWDQQKRYRVMEHALLSHIYSGGEEILTGGVNVPGKFSLHDLRILQEEVRKIPVEEEKIAEQEKELHDLRKQLAETQAQVAGLYQSTSWRVSAPLRKASDLAHQTKNSLSGFVREEKHRVGRAVRRKMPDRGEAQEKKPEEDYGTKRTEAELQFQRNAVFRNSVLISFVTPLFNTPIPFLRELIASVRAQTYQNWELCLVDFSTENKEEIRRVVEQAAAEDARISYYPDAENKGIAENTNTCIRHAKGTYLAILDHDDLVHPSALFEVMRQIERGADFIYTDEVKFTEEGGEKHLFSPNFKPDFAPEELQAHNYICHLNVYARELFDQTGGYRREFDGSQDHDMVLRLTEKAKCVAHVPKILYYWRVHEKSVAQNISAKPYATLSGEHAVDDQFGRLGYYYHAISVIGNIPTYKVLIPENRQEKVHVVLYDCADAGKANLTEKNFAVQYQGPLSFERTEEDLQGKLIYAGLLIRAGKQRQAGDLLRPYVHAEDPDTYILFARAGNHFWGLQQNGIAGMVIYTLMRGVSATDVRLENTKGKLISGGVIAAKDLHPYVQYRGFGKSVRDNGFENNFIHVRDASGVSGEITMFAPELFTASAENTQSGRIVWTPEVRGVLERKVEADALCSGLDLSAAEQVLPEQDPYYPEGIRKYHLE